MVSSFLPGAIGAPVDVLCFTVRHSAFLPGAIGAPVDVLCFTVRHSARIHGDYLVSFTDSCVSLARHPHTGFFLGHLRGV